MAAIVLMAPPAKRTRLIGKKPDPAAWVCAADAFAEAATAEELAHPDVKFAGLGVRRKHVHWTHGRSADPKHVQPSELTRSQFWAHLEKIYKEAYPVSSSPTGSVLAFGVVVQEAYAATSLGACPTHKHAPTFSTEAIFWNKIARLSREKYGIKLNAIAHNGYSDMYRYVRQQSRKKPLHCLDADPFFSPLHPKDDKLKDLLTAGDKACRLNSARTVAADGTGFCPAPRDRAPRLYEVIREQKLQSVTALKAHAEKEAAAGRTALAEFCTKHGGKLQGFLDGALSVMNAPQHLADAGSSRLDKLRRAAADRACECSGVWQPGALRILSLNGICPDVFCLAICTALHLGAKREVNIACVGRGGCGKSTLLEPLDFLFETLGKPQRGSTFHLGNLPGCDIALWQDFKHNEDTISWEDLLSVFVGEAIELRSPGQLNTKFRNTAPLFYSGRAPLKCKHETGEAAAELDRMMAERFAAFHFTKPFPKLERNKKWIHCPKCAASFYLRGAAAASVVGSGAPAAATSVAATLASLAAPSVAATTSVASPVVVGPAVVAALAQLQAMHAAGALDDDEFRAAKRSLLAL